MVFRLRIYQKKIKKEMKKKTYNWHFWLPLHKTQIVIDDVNFNAANKKAKDLCMQLYKDEYNKFLWFGLSKNKFFKDKLEFQFGQLI